MEQARGPAGLTFQVGLALGNSLCACLALWRWSRFVVVQKLRLNIPQICLLMEVFATFGMNQDVSPISI